MSDRRLTGWIVAAIGALALAWAALGWGIAPRLIESAYHEESWPVFNDIISGRDVHPLSTYLADWGRVAAAGFGVILTAGALVLLGTRARVQDAVDRWRGPLHPTLAAARAAATVPHRRRILLDGILLVALTASLACVALRKEVWPFSDYHMYSGLRTAEGFTRHNLYGVTGHGEFPLDVASHLAPFDLPRLHTGLLRVKLWKGEAALEQAMRSILELYERRRRQGAHDGPPLRGLRYYRLDWEVDPWARNRDQPRARKLVTELVFDG